jgi:hypothetical protein
MADPLPLEVAASLAALEGRWLGCISAVHPSRLPARCFASHASRLRMSELIRRVPSQRPAAGNQVSPTDHLLALQLRPFLV